MPTGTISVESQTLTDMFKFAFGRRRESTHHLTETAKGEE